MNILKLTNLNYFILRMLDVNLYGSLLNYLLFLFTKKSYIIFYITVFILIFFIVFLCVFNERNHFLNNIYIYIRFKRLINQRVYFKIHL